MIDASTTLEGIGAAAMLATAITMMVVPQRWRKDRSAGRERALAARLARGHDSYFEELRTLQAPYGPRHPLTVRIFGTLLFFLSAAFLTMLFFKS